MNLTRRGSVAGMTGRFTTSIIATLTLGAIAASGLTSPSQAQQVAARSGGLFSTVEYRRSNVHLLSKWHNVLQRAKAESRQADNCRAGRPCHVRDWKAFLGRTRNLPAMAQVRAVNRYINQWRYVGDRANYGKVDHWATPRQLFRSGGADCEDYAIAKYMSLRAMGWPSSKLRIVVLQDQNLRIAHAVLAVRMNGTFYILDNQIKTVVNHRRIHHYRPIYSMNEQHWWFHRGYRRYARRS